MRYGVDPDAYGKGDANSLAKADKEIQDAQPVTLGDLTREGRLLWCYCLSCQYEREVDPLSLGLDPAETVPSVGKRLKCSRCESREIETKPQLHLEPLEVLRTRYRQDDGITSR